MLCKQSPHVVALELSALLFFAAVLYGRNNFYRDPGSIFHDLDRSSEWRYSLYREREALAYRDQAHSTFRSDPAGTNHAFPKARPDPFLCGVFVTMGRETMESLHPLELSISSALAGMAEAERHDINLKVYFANTRPSEHPLFDSWILGLVDGWTTSQATADEGQYEMLLQFEAQEKFFPKTAYDFRNALRHCYDNSTAPYIALFEGDILFADGWLPRTKLAVREIVARTSAKNDKWQDLRLFNDEKGVGFESDSLFGNHVPLIILGIGLSVCTLLLTLRRISTLAKRHITISAILVLCFVTVPLFVMLFFQSGKSSVLPPSPGITEQNWGCCSQAIIMPRDMSIPLADFIVKQAGGPADMSMNDHANRNGLKRFALNPVQVQHIGLKSLLTPERTRKERVWSVAYENLKPVKLRKEHEHNVRKLYSDTG